MNEELKIWAVIAICLGLLFILLAGEMVLRRRNRRAIKAEAGQYAELELKKYDGFAPGEAVYLAWSEPEDFPRWHGQMQDEVRKNMPVLARALDRLVDN